MHIKTILTQRRNHMNAKALDNSLITNSLKKGTIFGIDSLKISAKVRLFSESTKEN